MPPDMSNSAPKHIADRLAEWGGAVGFASGVAFAAWSIGGPLVAGAAGACGFAAAFFLMTQIGRDHKPRYAFFPMELRFPEGEQEQHDGEDELLLNDPLVAVDDSRVVRLFAAEASHPAALVARIEDYLDRDPNRRDRGQEERRDEPVPDASAALHAALANIRASLR